MEVERLPNKVKIKINTRVSIDGVQFDDADALIDVLEDLHDCDDYFDKIICHDQKMERKLIDLGIIEQGIRSNCTRGRKFDMAFDLVSEKLAEEMDDTDIEELRLYNTSIKAEKLEAMEEIEKVEFKEGHLYSIHTFMGKLHMKLEHKKEGMLHFVTQEGKKLKIHRKTFFKIFGPECILQVVPLVMAL